jgi:hypothetical protein
MDNATCAKCGSDKIIPRARAVDRINRGDDAEMLIKVSADPRARFFTEDYHSAVYARVCAGCGHVELYADDTESLWDAYQQSLKRR